MDMAKSVVLPIIAILSAAAGILAILLSTVVGVSPYGDMLITAAEIMFGVGAALFTVYILAGFVSDVRAT
jgi:hypothetical protein